MPSQEVCDRAYSERMIAVKLLLSLASKLGYKYGIGLDDREDSDIECRRVVYVDLPDCQFSWHIAPQDWHMFEYIRPYNGKWDGTFLSKDKKFAEYIHMHNVPNEETIAAMEELKERRIRKSVKEAVKKISLPVSADIKYKSETYGDLTILKKRYTDE